MVLKIGHFGKYIKNALKVLKCGAGEGEDELAERMKNEKLLGYIESRSKGKSNMQ